MYATNQRRDYRVLASGLSSQVVNEIDARPAAARLRQGEYITSIRFEFGTVQPGFREVTPPHLIFSVNEGLPNEYRIVNRADVGGHHEDEWVIARDAWVTIVLGCRWPWSAAANEVLTCTGRETAERLAVPLFFFLVKFEVGIKCSYVIALSSLNHNNHNSFIFNNIEHQISAVPKNCLSNAHFD